MQDKGQARTRNQERRLERKIKGLCVRCAAPNDNPTSYICKACSEKARQERIRHKEKYKAEGKCLTCGKPVEKIGESKCPACKAKMNRNHRKLYAENKDLRICTRCGKRRAEKGKTKCWQCLERDAELSVEYRERLSDEQLEHRRKLIRKHTKKRRKAAREAGTCIVCLKNKAVSGKSMCVGCIRKQDRRNYERKIIRGSLNYDDCLLTGTCTMCRKKPREHGMLCDTCYASAMERLALANASKAYLRNKRIIRASISAGFALNRAYKR